VTKAPRLAIHKAMQDSLEAIHTTRKEPLCVDVDGTILATDLLYESFLAAFKRDPAVLFLSPLWLLKGRAFLKRKLAARAQLAVELLPLNEVVIDYLRTQADAGRSILLVSASDVALVEKVADRLDFVDGVIASEGVTNCKGSAKAAAIKARLGAQGWEYVGDSSADFDVWKEAVHVTCVSSSASFSKRVSQTFPKATIISKKGAGIKVLLRALRVHQWAKNLLVFLPLVLAHQLFNLTAWGQAVSAALAFSLCASGVYLLNDLLDLEADRAHPRKRRRPYAAGLLPLSSAIVLAPLLFASAFVIAALVSPAFTLVLAIYLVITTGYSYRLKALMFVDIITLAILYTIRLVGGGIATHVEVSQWLLALSMFLFVSLACVKRFSELLVLRNRNESRPRGRGYLVGDIDQVAMFGSSSAYIAVLVLALYVSSKEIIELYRTPQVIWLACPLLMYWISRTWLLARRGLVHDDPLVFALRDKVTYVVVALGMLIFLAAKW
jgi:4-hydroxybenzoate polyprenyltransferase